MFISKKHLEEIKKAEYQRGLGLGYEIGFKYRQIDIRNRSMIGTKVDAEISEIIRKNKL